MKHQICRVLFLLMPFCALSQALELVVPRYHRGVVTSLDLSADGKFLISVSNGNEIFLREASTGNFLREFEMKSDVIMIRFLADSKHFLIQTSAGIEIRDIGNQKLKQEIKGEFYSRKVITNPYRNEFLAIKDAALILYAETNGVFKPMKTILSGGNPLQYFSYSQDGQKLVILNGSIRLYDFQTGRLKLIDIPSIPFDSVQSLALHKNNVTLAIGLKNGVVKFFDVTRNAIFDSLKLFQSYWSGRYRKGFIKDSIQTRYPVIRLSFTDSGYMAGYYSNNDPWKSSGFVAPEDLDHMWDNLQRELDGRKAISFEFLVLWDLVQRKAKTLLESDCYPFVLCLDQVATKAGIQNFVTGAKNTYEGVNSSLEQVKFSEDGRKLLVKTRENVSIWNLATGRNFVVDYPLLNSDHLDTYKNHLGINADHYYHNRPALLDMDSGKIVRQFKVNGSYLRLNSTKQHLAFVDGGKSEADLSVIDFSNDKVLYHEYDSSHRYDFAFSENGRFFISKKILLSSEDYSVLDTIPVEQPTYLQVPVYAPTQHRLFVVADGHGVRNTIIVRDYFNHKNIDTLFFFYEGEKKISIKTNYHTTSDFRKELLEAAAITSIDVSADEKLLAVAFGNGLISLIDPIDFRILKTHISFPGGVWSIDFSPDNRFIVAAGSDGSIRFWDLKTDELIAKILFYGKDWVVVNRDNLFDGSAGGLAKLFFINGLQTIELNQLKTRYYEPGLLKKIINGEKLRNVLGFDKVELPPEIRVGQVDKSGNLSIEVINRGGGIGEVSLYINGKEAVKDLRKPGTDGKGQTLTFSIPISSSNSLVPGTENFLAVKAWNAGQWIESRGAVVKYTPSIKTEIKPSIHILVCGVSDYTRDEIDLKYAAKDAEEMSKALELGARRLFGTAKSYVYTLTTSQKPDRFPTKSNILKTFSQISATALSTDVFVVYFSGHGINLGGSDGDFHYLTQDAYTANAAAYNDPAIKQQTTISSQELVELFKKVPALKQVLMIDACASGKVVDNLMAKRDIESGTLRALDRMKDRTGMHIITGCTADAVSYEASRYGQGVLTYSLLEGLRGLALREEKYVDVSQLFQFAQERVPVLASGIGGIQTPQVFSPNGSQSFDFGELTPEDKKQIPISASRPVYIRSNFIDEQKLRDGLGLGKKMDEMLNEVAVKGESSPLLFVDVSEYPEGCQLSGLYKQLPGKITLRLNKICEGQETSYNVEAMTEKELLEKIMGLLGK